MQEASSKAWYDTRPAAVFMSAFYCLIVFVQACLWVLHVGISQTVQGMISFVVPLVICTVALLMFVGGVFLMAKKQSSSRCFILALLLGLTFTGWHMRDGTVLYVLTLPMFKEYALILGIWVYSLQLRTAGYFTSK